MRLKILPSALRDLQAGYRFYEAKEPGVGEYFLSEISSDIDSLTENGGIYPRAFGNLRRLVSKRFPFAVFYDMTDNEVIIHAVFDCRRDPERLQRRLKSP